MSSIKQAAEEMLLQTIIPFWKGLRDEENGGFYGYMDFDLKLDKKAEKGCILNSRILWFFSEAAMLTGRTDLAEDARHAYQFFLKNCYDEANGGVYWSCDYTGKPQDTTKHTYNQGFAIYALSAYYRLTKDPVALTYATGSLVSSTAPTARAIWRPLPSTGSRRATKSSRKTVSWRQRP